jgi:hypothetical protein
MLSRPTRATGTAHGRHGHRLPPSPAAVEVNPDPAVQSSLTSPGPGWGFSLEPTP